MTSRILPQLSAKQVLAFWQKITITADVTRCWLWQWGLNDAGYGRVRIDWNEYRSHRLAYFIFYGVDPGELDVLHDCDNPPCCNPHHLFKGTPEDNARDREKKGRGNQPQGEKNASAKLTADEVREIRQLYAAGGETHHSLAARFDTPHQNIGGIIRRIYWKHIE